MDSQENPPPAEERARQRLQVLLEVLNGKITGVQAAKRLGVSRKTWCERQALVLDGLLPLLSDRPAGRPARPRDQEKEDLRRQLADQKRLNQELQAKLQVTKTLNQLFEEEAAESKKKP